MTMTASRFAALTVPRGWIAPALWSVPRDWTGDRCFVLCGGASLTPQIPLLPRLRGRVIAVKQAARLYPHADMMFVAGEHGWENCGPIFPLFRGTHLVTRGRGDARFPAHTKRIGRSVDGQFSLEPTQVGGLDAGTSAINLASLFGATEIILLGYDMRGGHWDPTHRIPFPPQSDFDRHLAILPAFAFAIAGAGVRVVNCSPGSAVTVFERQPLEAFL